MPFTWSAPKELEVRLSRSGIVRLTEDRVIGVVRKQLGLTFLGETRESDRLVLADIYIKGINTEVSQAALTAG